MEEKGFRNKKGALPALPEDFSFPEKESGIKAKIAGFSSHLFGIIKLLLGICLLPFVYSTTLAFLNEGNALGKTLNSYFFGGIIGFLAVYLFIYEPAIVYNKGQKILAAGFGFFTPLERVAPYLLLVYTLILFAVYALYSFFDRRPEPLKYFIFLFGFSFALHLVFSAKSLRSRQSDFLKSNYIFGFSFLYIINFAILAFGLSSFFNKFSFVNFCNQSFQLARGIFYVVFKQLFL